MVVLNMITKKFISVAHEIGLKQWGNTIERHLGFASVNTFIPAGFDPDLFVGNMIIDEFNNGGFKVHVNSSAQKTRLQHTDQINKVKTKFIVLNSCGSLLLKNNGHRGIISGGDSILIPAWDSYTEESFSNRNSLSLLFDIEDICASATDISSLFWRNVSSFEYGVEINKIISNFYHNNNDAFCEKNVDALLSLLRLETESLRLPKRVSVSRNCRSSFVLTFIRENLKKPNLRLADLANYMGVTERAIQYSLSKENTTFQQLLSTERSRFLASQIKNKPDMRLDVIIWESGYLSLSSAVRQFKKTFNMTPRQYQRYMLSGSKNT